MPSCSEVLALLLDYLEGRLPEATRRDLERHLAGCASCDAALATYRATVGMLRSLTEDDLPPDLRLRLRAFLDRSTAS
jgi:anti-sigma factor RsiW